MPSSFLLLSCACASFSNLLLSGVGLPTFARRFAMVREPASLRRRFADCRSQVRRGSRTCDVLSSFRRLSYAGLVAFLATQRGRSERPSHERRHWGAAVEQERKSTRLN